MPNLGLTNPYLKIGLGLVLLGLVLIVASAFTPSFVALYLGGIFFWSGVIIYIGGRIAKSRRSRGDG